MKKKTVIKLLKLVQKNGCEFCSTCEQLGQKLSECNNLTNKKCAKHLIELFEAERNKEQKKDF